MDAQYKYRYWNIAVKKGYGEHLLAIPAPVVFSNVSRWTAGTAVFSKHKPLNITYVLEDIATPDLVKGRLVILEFQTFYLVATYVPNAGAQLKVGCLSFRSS